VIQVTRDGGRSWQDVTPKGLPDWSRVAQIDASPIAPGSAFAAIDRHRMDDDRPYVYVTRDFGKTWKLSSAGLPDGSHVNVVRQDLVRPELLFAGTRTGIHVSFDGGGSWQPLQLDLPTSGVNDLTVHGNDLIVATEGRAIWVLDDISPLRNLKGERGPALLPPAKAYRVSFNQNRDTPLPNDEPRAANPPAGAAIDYLLPAGTSGPVVLEIVDGGGKVVRSFRSDRAEERPEANQYFDDDWLQPPAPLPARAEHNRFVWNLRLPRPKVPEYDFSIAAVPGADTQVLPQGLMAAPGKYEVRLTVDGRTLAQPLELLMDPRVDSTPADVEAQHAFYREVVEALERGAAALAAGENDEVEAALGALTALATDVEGVDRRPTAAQREVLDTYRKRLDEALKSVKPSGRS
jgi:hypothetical protein